MGPWQKASIFVAGSLVGGLALAFLIVLARPELLTRPAAAPATVESIPVTEAPAPSTAPPPKAAPPETLMSYAAAVRAAAPAVVNIYVARVVTERVRPSFFDDPFGDFRPRYRQRVERSLGSGVILDGEGRIVTNHHVVANADTVRVQLADGREAEARILGRDPETDLALLRISLPKLPVISVGRSDTLSVGDVVLAIGNPIGLSQTVTQGIVSATGRDQIGVAIFENFIQTDAPINVGNSGGALINTRGELVGINTAVIAKDLGVEGIGFAIPVNLMRGVVAEIQKRGRVVRGWIGIATEGVSDTDAKAAGYERGGLLVTQIYPGGPAQQAGLRRGDLILSIDGRAPRSSRELLQRVARAEPGASLTLEVQRGNQRGELRLTVAEPPAERGAR
ncbi:MAG: S1C family serine protease [Steroidobacteraceae bacterium]